MLNPAELVNKLVTGLTEPKMLETYELIPGGELPVAVLVIAETEENKRSVEEGTAVLLTTAETDELGRVLEDPERITDEKLIIVEVMPVELPNDGWMVGALVTMELGGEDEAMGVPALIDVEEAGKAVAVEEIPPRRLVDTLLRVVLVKMPEPPVAGVGLDWLPKDVLVPETRRPAEVEGELALNPKLPEELGFPDIALDEPAPGLLEITLRLLGYPVLAAVTPLERTPEDERLVVAALPEIGVVPILPLPSTLLRAAELEGTLAPTLRLDREPVEVPLVMAVP